MAELFEKVSFDPSVCGYFSVKEFKLERSEK